VVGRLLRVLAARRHLGNEHSAGHKTRGVGV
jgi:hypothetical protein